MSCGIVQWEAKIVKKVKKSTGFAVWTRAVCTGPDFWHGCFGGFSGPMFYFGLSGTDVLGGFPDQGFPARKDVPIDRAELCTIVWGQFPGFQVLKSL